MTELIAFIDSNVEIELVKRLLNELLKTLRDRVDETIGERKTFPYSLNKRGFVTLVKDL